MSLGKGKFGDHWFCKQIRSAFMGRDPHDLAKSKTLGNDKVGLHGDWTFELYSPEGELKWADGWSNVVVNDSLTSVLDTYLRLQSANIVSAWYVGLLEDNTGWNPALAGTWDLADAVANEFTFWNGSNRPQWSGSTPTIVPTNIAQTANSSPMSFTLGGGTQPYTIGGAFMCDVLGKGSGTGANELYAAGAWVGGANKTGNDNDTLQVTATFTATSTLSS